MIYLENRQLLNLNEERKEDLDNSGIKGISDFPMHKKPVFDRPDTIYNNGS